jgi:ribosomal protein S18 acetylase RimI-like enzyme
VADAPAISALFAKSFTATFGTLYTPHDLVAFLAQLSPEAFAGEIADPAFAFRLAEAGGVLAGYIKLGPSNLPVETPPDTIELRQLYVDSEWHGAGVAKALIDWGFDEARRRGAKQMQLSVYIDNHRARRFYERYGFVEVGKYQFKVGDHLDDDRVMRVAL